MCFGFQSSAPGPCARCNLRSSLGPRCSPSAEVLAPRFRFGPSFHGKLNNHMRERKGERARERGKKKPTYRQFFQKWKEPKHILAPSALKGSYFPPDLEQPFQQHFSVQLFIKIKSCPGKSAQGCDRGGSPRAAAAVPGFMDPACAAGIPTNSPCPAPEASGSGWPGSAERDPRAHI